MPATPLRAHEQSRRSVRELFTSWRIVAVMASALGAFLAGCASSDGTPTDVAPNESSPSIVGSGPTTSDGAASGVQPVGFRSVEAQVTAADGEVCDLCLWLAGTAEMRSRGLMGVTDLGAADGMVFTWDEPVQSNFVMIGTPTPLSIAWFANDGSFVSTADMEPCLDTDPSTCARYPADAPYTAAIEVFQGGLEKFGIGPGARFELLAGSESSECADPT